MTTSPYVERSLVDPTPEHEGITRRHHAAIGRLVPAGADPHTVVVLDASEPYAEPFVVGLLQLGALLMHGCTPFLGLEDHDELLVSVLHVLTSIHEDHAPSGDGNAVDFDRPIGRRFVPVVVIDDATISVVSIPESTLRLEALRGLS